MTYSPGGGSGSIATSSDVALNNPDSGQALSYDASIAKWINRSIPTVIKITRAEYDALGTKDENVFYAIVQSSESADPTPPGVSTFTDMFDMLDANKWTIYPGASVSGGELVLDASSSYSTIRTIGTFTLTGSKVHIQVKQLPNVSNGSTQAWINFRYDALNSLTLMWSNNALFCRLAVAGAETEVQVAYDVASMQLWQLREASGTLYWETSLDGRSWTSHRTAPMPAEWVTAAGQISLQSGNYNSATSPGQAKFDNLNISDFIDTFTAGDGSAWDSTKWTLSPLLAAATDINANRGRLSIPDTEGAMVRMIAKAPTTSNQNLLMSYTLTDTTARTWIQIWLRGDGTWSGNKPGHGYAVEIASDSARVSILKYASGAQTGLAATDGVNSLIAGQKQWLRFEANETTIRYRIWADGAVEPATWTASVANNDLPGPGHFQVCAYRSTTNVGAKTVYFDDIVLNDRVTGGETPADPDGTTPLDEQMNGTYNLTHSNNGTHPHLVLEWSGLTAISINTGILTIPTGSTEYHRVYFATRRYGGPGKPLTIRYRARVTQFHQTVYNNTIAGANVWLKFPHDNVNQEDWTKVISGGTYKPTTMIFRNGFSPKGRVEHTVYDGYQRKYINFGNPKDIGYTVGSWKDVTIRVEFVGSDQIRLRYWHNSTGSGTPTYDWTGYVPAHNKAGFLAFRTDFCRAEYDYFTATEG